MDSLVERRELVVLRLRADMRGKGPAEAFERLERTLPTIRGRRFYGAFRILPEGEEYFACVERIATDDAERMALEVATLPGGRYMRRRLFDWLKTIESGDLGKQYQEMVRSYPVDPSRPSLEFYRSQKEMQILLPVTSSAVAPAA
jgi:hypothetical protein